MASVQVSKYLSVLTDANPMTPRAKSNGKWNEGQTKLTKRIPTTQKKRENRLNRLANVQRERYQINLIPSLI
jgi:hypothetical protein